MDLSMIKPCVQTKNGMTGGVEDIGNFKEGFCLKVTSNGDAGELAWILCSHDLLEKRSLD